MISVIVPLYNEEKVINETYKRLTLVLSDEEYEIIFVNDGSRDKTVPMAREIADKDNRIKLISFSRNFGHQTAVTAGIDHAEGDAVVIIDADLQDPPEVIPKMIEKWREGYEIVYGKRIKRKGETFFKKATAAVFYKILNRLTEVEIPENAGDFRLLDKKVCDVMRQSREHNRYLRGLSAWAGFSQYPLEFVREERFAGTTEYTLKKMLKLAEDGLMSFSYKPLKLPGVLGTIVTLGAVIYLISSLFGYGDIQNAISYILDGFILMSISIVGQYISRIFDEAKGRPLYIIKEKYGFKD